jgi:hypothetical protein
MYPKVLGEVETLDRVLAGESIARYGDGELKLMFGKGCVSQTALPNLAAEMRKIIGAPTKVRVCIPTLDVRNPKYASWLKLAPKFEGLLETGKVYASAFITRPDNAPWINNKEFFDKIQSLWAGQRVTFVGNGVRSLTADFLLSTGAKQVDWIKSEYRDAYKTIGRLYQQCVELDNHRIILCVGPTATCLAERLAVAGRHAIDLGHIGMFWRAYEMGRHTFIEQREINKETNIVEPNP